MFGLFDWLEGESVESFELLERCELLVLLELELLLVTGLRLLLVDLLLLR